MLCHRLSSFQNQQLNICRDAAHVLHSYSFQNIRNIMLGDWLCSASCTAKAGTVRYGRATSSFITCRVPCCQKLIKGLRIVPIYNPSTTFSRDKWNKANVIGMAVQFDVFMNQPQPRSHIRPWNNSPNIGEGDWLTNRIEATMIRTRCVVGNGSYESHVLTLYERHEEFMYDSWVRFRTDRT
jgi:hypothetical protein